MIRVLVPVLAAAVALSTAGLGRSLRAPTATNYRGRRVPVTLGVAVAMAILLSVPIHVVSARGDGSLDPGAYLSLVAGVAAVFAVGLFDDARPDPTRGLVAHLLELRRGRVTSGVVKLVVIVGAAVLVAVTLDGGWLRLGLGVPAIAGTANVWNLLDVRPGRALKFFVPLAVPVAILVQSPESRFLLEATLGAAAAVLLLDLRELAMLGDSGANVLGFVAGAGLLALLPTWGLGMVLAAVLAVHALSETVTLSELIRATTPLRWFDDLGRIRVGSDPDRRENG